ncbi:uncharacterized protein K441DRAFT_531873, partial [Cenococcum geophilum 1.58]|uniref:uncharacterized protein n=1 Tax=Cenococcum geophilum 1.58 TaxID=794803 RepID=UPI00358E67DD
VAFAGFIRVGEFTYNIANRKNDKTFAAIKLIRGDVRFIANYARLILKRSKTDKAYKGVNIILARSRDSACPVEALEALFMLDLYELGQPLFCFKRAIFNRNNFLKRLTTGLLDLRVKPGGYLSYSFRKGAA